MARIRNFHEALEKDLQNLTAEIKEKQTEPGVEKLPEREVLKQSIQSFAVAASAAPAASDTSLADDNLPDYLQKGDSKIKLEVERLISLVFHESLEKAVREAKHHGPFVEDAFHDALVDKLMPELKRRGALK